MTTPTLTADIDPTERTASITYLPKIGFSILGATLVFGILGDLLLRATPWGLNAGLWLLLLTVTLTGLAWRFEIKLTGAGRWLFPPALAFAAALAWRASPTLTFLNLLALLIALALAAAYAREGRLRLISLIDGLLSGIQTMAQAGFGFPILIFSEIPWRSVSRDGWSRPALALLRGLLIAVPLLCVFGGLFVAADAVFEGIVTDLFDWQVDHIFSHLFWIIFWAWLTGGFLRQLFISHKWAGVALQPTFFSLGLIELVTVLGLLDALFLSFVLVQFRYLFGGAALVEAATGLTYAEYARRGFFELVTVAALLLPILLFIHWLLRPGSLTVERAFRLLAGLLVALLFVIMASALQRMRLYQQEYGLTELRLYTTVFMGWLALVFLWFSATVLARRRVYFTFGALAAGLAVIMGLNLLNPDALIAQVNANRTNAPQPFDARYVTWLSADAVPTLVTLLPQMKEEDRCLIATALLYDWSPPEQVDWRTWNWSRSQAWQAVGANKAYLQQEACPLR